MRDTTLISAAILKNEKLIGMEPGKKKPLRKFEMKLTIYRRLGVV